MQPNETAPGDLSPPTWQDPATPAKARDTLERAEYNEAAIAQLLGTPEIPSARERRQQLPLFLFKTRGDTSLATLGRLFLLDQPVSLDAFRRAIQPMPIDDWIASGLVTVKTDEVRAAVELIPFQGLLLAADWLHAGLAEPVMGIARTSRVLAQLTVRRRVTRTLDIGVGCGVQSLLAARQSDRVSATDLNPRAIKFARFNAELNGLSNLDLHIGNGFEPVRGQEFGLIVCNPPFVIGPGQGQMHSQSGHTADGFLQKMIQTAPQFLRPDGFFQIVGDWAQIAGQDWRQRLAGWFDASGCDAWVLHSEIEPIANYASQRISETADPNQSNRLFGEWMEYYERERIEGVVSGAITLRRAARRPNWNRFDRFQGVSGQAGSAIERGFRLRDFLETQRDDRDLLQTKLHPTRGLCWEPRYEMSNAGWSPAASRLRLADGLRFAASVDPSVAAFVAKCRGDRPLGDQFRDLAASTGQDADRLLPSFLQVIRRLIEAGFLLPAEME